MATSPVRRYATEAELQSPTPDLLLNNLRKEGASAFGISVIRFPKGAIKWDIRKLNAVKRKVLRQSVTKLVPKNKSRKLSRQRTQLTAQQKSDGLFQLLMMDGNGSDEIGDSLDILEYKKMSACKAFVGLNEVTLDEVFEEIRKGSLTKVPYCAGLMMPDFMKSLEFTGIFDLRSLGGGILKYIRAPPFSYDRETDDSNDVEGITSLMAYIGIPGTLFALHKEDMAVISLHYLLDGKKVWITVPLSQTRRMWELLAKFTGDKCPSFQCHKYIVPSLDFLNQNGIQVYVVEQNPDDLVITWEDGVHFGFNTKFSIGIATNFAQPASIHHSVRTPRDCRCRFHNPTFFDVTFLVQMFYPEHFPLEQHPNSFFHLDPLDPHILQLKFLCKIGTESQNLPKFEAALISPITINTDDTPQNSLGLVNKGSSGIEDGKVHQIKDSDEGCAHKEEELIADDPQTLTSLQGPSKKKERKSIYSEERRTCKLCGEVFKNSPWFTTTFKTHMRRHENKNNNTRPHQCSACPKSFITVKDLYAHNLRVHKKVCINRVN